MLIDIGNTRCKYITVTNHKRSAVMHCSHEQLTEQWLTTTFAQATEVILANVSTELLTGIIKQWANIHAIPFQLLHTQHQQFELTCAYKKPEQLGIDRWLSVLAASSLFPNQACLIVDAGTATTIDAISSDGQHLGGWILPGIELLFQSLVSNTQKVAATQISEPNIRLGNNTSECVNYGAWGLTVGAIELQCNALKKQYPAVQVILTGGNSEKISPLLSVEHQIAADLVFIGMQRFSG